MEFDDVILSACGGQGSGAEATGADSDAPHETTTDASGTDADTRTVETEEETTVEEETAPVSSGVEAYDELMSDLSAFPIMFRYGSGSVTGFGGFETVSSETTEVPGGQETVTVLRRGDINADFRLVTRVFPQENAYEYVVYIENHSDTNTEIIKDLKFSVTFEGEKPYLSGMEGDGGVSWYKEYEKDLVKVGRALFRSTSGRPTHHVFPYFNLNYGSGDRTSGTFVAVGWPGTWNASFTYKNNVTTLTAGQNDVATYIAPGETLRTPLMAFVSYENTPVDEQANVWRHYYLNDVLPKTQEGEMAPMLAGFSTMSQGMTTDMMKLTLNLYKKNGIKLSTVWMDAGWYVGPEGEGVAWSQTGTMNFDTQRFPDKLSTIGDYCKDNDIRFVLWFEPEDIRFEKDVFVKNTPGFKEEWLLGKTMVGSWLEGYLFDLGNEEARAWLIGKVSGVIEASGLTVYRQDFNSDPAGAWAANDDKDRKGMTENRYVQGYLAYWDALLEKYPYLMIDSCASGGGRNDLETMKRSVPLHYSDLFDGSGDANNVEKTRMTQSLFAWLPYFKNEAYSNTVFSTRINYAPYSLLKMPSVMNPKADWAGLKRAYDERAQVTPYFYKDYYQLTPYSESADRWNGWEFFDKETNGGFAELICNPGCTTLTHTFALKGLDADKTYTVKDFDGIVDKTATGRELMEAGLEVTVPEASYCVIVLIQGQ